MNEQNKEPGDKNQKKIKIRQAHVNGDFNVVMGKNRAPIGSLFEQSQERYVKWQELDQHRVVDLWRRVSNDEATIVDTTHIRDQFRVGRLLWQDGPQGEYYATALGVMLLAPNPTITYPQAGIIAEAYLQRHDETLLTQPNDLLQTQEPVCTAIDKVFDFIRRNTKQTFRIDGLDRVEVTEYPDNAVREALVNAVAHRDYERTGERIRVWVYKDDRIVIMSPGRLLRGLTVTKLKHGIYQPVSRNPLLASYLSRYQRIEQRGFGIKMMSESMFNHGLCEPDLQVINGGLFEVTLIGPGESLNGIKTTGHAWRIPEAKKAKLNDRQRKIIKHLHKEGTVTSGWCREQFSITYDTANRDLKGLIKLGTITREGKGRATYYVLSEEVGNGN